MNESDEMFLDRASRRTLMSWLRDFRWLAGELDVVTSRETRYSSRSERKSADTPVVFNPASAALAADIRDVCMSWVRNVCEVRHLPLPHPSQWTTLGAPTWLYMHVVDLAQIEPARLAFEEIRELHSRAMRMVDRPRDMEFVGPCQSDVDGVECGGVYVDRGVDTKRCAFCDVCVDVPRVMAETRSKLEDRLYSEAELRAALGIVLRRSVPRQTVRAWIDRGKLTDHGGGRFDLSEAIELVERKPPRRAAGAKR